MSDGQNGRKRPRNNCGAVMAVVAVDDNNGIWIFGQAEQISYDGLIS